MLVYISMIALSLIIVSICQKYRFTVKGKEYDWSSVLLTATPLFIVSCFRASNVGIDYTAYTETYYEVGNLDLGRETELLGTEIIKFAQMMNKPMFIIFFYSLTICIGIIYWITKQSKYKKMALIIFFLSGFFNWSLNIMRQSLATVIFLIYVKQIQVEKRTLGNYIKFVLGIIIASMFHKTAIMYLLFLVFPYNVFVKHYKKFLILLPVSVIFSYGLKNLIMMISQYFNFYYRYFNNYYDQSTYTGSLIFINIITILLVAITHEKWSKLERKYAVWASIQYIGTFMSLIANIIPNNARITYLFFPVSIILIPEFLNLVSKKNRNYITLLVLCSYAVFYVSSYVISDWGETMNYKWIFFQ